MDKPVYSLEQLAEDFDLTARTARYYLEKVLPESHRSGPGRAGQYGQATWNCFAFIRRAKEEKLTLAQIADVLARLDQEQIDRVATGLEALTIVPSSSAPQRSFPFDMASASRRYKNFPAASEPLSAYALQQLARNEMSFDSAHFLKDSAHDGPAPDWRVLYEDDELQVRHTGRTEPDREQRDQVRLAAELIKKILQRK